MKNYDCENCNVSLLDDYDFNVCPKCGQTYEKNFLPHFYVSSEKHSKKYKYSSVLIRRYDLDIIYRYEQKEQIEKILSKILQFDINHQLTQMYYVMKRIILHLKYPHWDLFRDIKDIRRKKLHDDIINKYFEKNEPT